MTSLWEVERCFDLGGWLASRGFQAAKGNVLLHCPQCGKEKLSLHVERRKWHCWVCQGKPGVTGAGGIVDLLMVVEGLLRAEAIAFAEAHAVAQTVNGPVAGQLDPAELLSVTSAVEIPYPPNWHPITSVLPYMVERGITLADAQQYRLGWCDAGPYHGRLVFPVFEEGRLVYFQARAMWRKPSDGSDYRKALNPPATPGAAVSSDLLMNLDIARRFPRVAVVEGPMDCLRAGPDAVCTFGKRISPAQVAKLIRAGVEAVDLMWDADAAAEIIAGAAMLAPMFDVRAVFLDRGDPADHTRYQLLWFRENGVRYGRAPQRGALAWV